MEDDATERGIALIKRSTRLAIKISLAVLVPICAVCWLAFGGLIAYKSVTFGVSPLAVIDARHFSKIADGLLASVELVVVGVAFSAVTGALIGTVVAGIRRGRT